MNTYLKRLENLAKENKKTWKDLEKDRDAFRGLVKHVAQMKECGQDTTAEYISALENALGIDMEMSKEDHRLACPEGYTTLTTAAKQIGTTYNALVEFALKSDYMRKLKSGKLTINKIYGEIKHVSGFVRSGKEVNASFYPQKWADAVKHAYVLTHGEIKNTQLIQQLNMLRQEVQLELPLNA